MYQITTAFLCSNSDKLNIEHQVGVCGDESATYKNQKKSISGNLKATRTIIRDSEERCSCATEWQRLMGCLIFTGHFTQKSATISGSFAERVLQQASYAIWPPCNSTPPPPYSLCSCCDPLRHFDVYVCICARVYVYVCVCVCIYVHACVCVCVRVCTCIYIYIRTHNLQI